MSAVISDPTKIRSQLSEEVLGYLAQIAARAAEVPAYYPAHLRSLERGKTRFDEIRQTIQVVQDREIFQKWLAEQLERQRAAGYPTESLVYSRATPTGVLSDSLDESPARPTPIPWDEQAGQRFRRVVILGDPGLGKTWLLRYEARRIARASSTLLEDASIPLEQMEFPFHLRLSDLNRTKGTIEEALIGLVGEGHSESFRGLMKRKLEGEGAVLLLDAWDEVGEREELRQRLESFARRRPAARMLVTSRIVGYEMAPWPEAEEVELLAFGRTEVEAFVGVWFADQAEQGKAFRQTLEQNQAVTGLAEIPLMLALMCRSWTGQESGLAQRRGELYERCLTGLLRDWKQTKGKKAEDVVLEGVRQRLGRAAEELFRGQKEQFTEAELGRALGYRIEEESEAREAQRFIDERKAEGILIGANAEGSQLLFLHRTFQEYLTAQSLAGKGWEEIAGLIDKKAWLPGWQEVIVLLAGQLADPGPLLDLLANEAKDDYFRHRLAVAAHCLPEIPMERRDTRLHAVTSGVALALAQSSETWQLGFTHLEKSLPRLFLAQGLVEGQSLFDWLMSRCHLGYPCDELSRSTWDKWRWARYRECHSAWGWLRQLSPLASALSDLRERIIQELSCSILPANDWTLQEIRRSIGMTETQLSIDELRRLRDKAWFDDNLVDHYSYTVQLLRLGDPATLDELAELLRDDGNSVEKLYAAQALYSAGKAAFREDIVDALVLSLRDNDETMRYTSTLALQRLGVQPLRCPGLIDMLSALLEDPDDWVRGCAAEALARDEIAASRPDVVAGLAKFVGRGGSWNTRLIARMVPRAVPMILDSVLQLGRECDQGVGRAVSVIKSLGAQAARKDVLDWLLQLVREKSVAPDVFCGMGSAAARGDILEELVRQLEEVSHDPWKAWRVADTLLKIDPKQFRQRIDPKQFRQNILPSLKFSDFPDWQDRGLRIFEATGGAWRGFFIEELAS